MEDAPVTCMEYAGQLLSNDVAAAVESDYNVHFNLFPLLRDCSTIAQPYFAVAMSLYQNMEHAVESFVGCDRRLLCLLTKLVQMYAERFTVFTLAWKLLANCSIPKFVSMIASHCITSMLKCICSAMPVRTYAQVSRHMEHANI